MLARLPLLLAHFAVLGCGINNNCGKYNPFGCAKGDESGEVEVTSVASETTGTTPASTSTGSTTTVGESSTGTTTPVEPTTSTSTTSSTTIETATLDTTTTDSSMTGDTTDSTAETNSTTEGSCGNGVVDDMEECDDGNAVEDDGCNLCIAVHRKVFVSSTVHNGNLGGLLGADGICKQLASSAGLVGTFRAWLSTGNMSAADRIGPVFTGFYELTDGTKVAVGLEGLTINPLENAINKNEKGVLVAEATAWTNTNSDGTPSEEDCNSWLWSGIFLHGTTIGSIVATNSNWTKQTTNQTCSSDRHLYCFEVQ